MWWWWCTVKGDWVSFRAGCCRCRFWEAAQDLKALPQSQVGARALEIWNEFLGPEAKCPVNVDSKSHEATRLAMDKADRWTFDRAAVISRFFPPHIHNRRLKVLTRSQTQTDRPMWTLLGQLIFRVGPQEDGTARWVTTPTRAGSRPLGPRLTHGLMVVHYPNLGSRPTKGADGWKIP